MGVRSFREYSLLPFVLLDTYHAAGSQHSVEGGETARP
jgi:hypothetical protein